MVWQFGGDNDKCKFNDMFSSVFSFSGNVVSISTNFDFQDVENALREGMDSVTGPTRSERRRGNVSEAIGYIEGSGGGHRYCA